MDTVYSLQYEPGVLLGKSVYFIFTGFHIELLAHSQQTTKFQKLTQTNLSIFLFQSSTIVKMREISKISLIATKYPATLSQLRSIHEISPLDPPVNHSIFRTKAYSEISPVAPPIS